MFSSTKAIKYHTKFHHLAFHFRFLIVVNTWKCAIYRSVPWYSKDFEFYRTLSRCANVVNLLRFQYAVPVFTLPVPTVPRGGKHGKVDYFSWCSWYRHDFRICPMCSMFVNAIYHLIIPYLAFLLPVSMLQGMEMRSRKVFTFFIWKTVSGN
jgi:hypothetical protein